MEAAIKGYHDIVVALMNVGADIHEKSNVSNPLLFLSIRVYILAEQHLCMLQ
jgi:hypothetical protein